MLIKSIGYFRQTISESKQKTIIDDPFQHHTETIIERIRRRI